MTEKVRVAALGMGMDLVGFGPVERWENAPYLISPEAILPEAKTVVVAAMHITDTWTEMGGEPEPQGSSPGGWMSQNDLLDRVAFRVARLLQNAGYATIPVVSSNIWRYRRYEGIPSLFAPDLSHIHAATAAGLAEIGWSGLAITPEFGSRVRFVSIVTAADLVPTPMYDGSALCDRCGECIKHCPTGALRTDFNSSAPHEVEIGGKVFKYCNKNIWRCAWAEHFDMDLNSPTLKEKGLHVDEKVILSELKGKGVRGHERGVCQKWCVPPHLRSAAPSFGRADKRITQNRINRRYPENMPTLRKMRDDVFARASSLGFELCAAGLLDTTKPAGQLAVMEAPGMKTVLAFALRVPDEFNDADKLPNKSGVAYKAACGKRHTNLLVLSRMIEDYGYHAASYGGCWVDSPGSQSKRLCDMTDLGTLREDGVFITPEFGANQIVAAITTDAPLPATGCGHSCPQSDVNVRTPLATTHLPLSNYLRRLADDNLVTLYGVTPAARLEPVVAALRASFDESTLGSFVRDTNSFTPRHGEYIPEIKHDDIKFRAPSDYVHGAKSVVVLGMHFPKELVENAGLEKSQQIGCYNFHQFQSVYELRYAALEIATELARCGFKTAITENLLGIGSYTDSPRELLPDFRSGALEAVAAGLGVIGKHGGLMTPKYGSRQRVICIVTDAELKADEVAPQTDVCADCSACVRACPMNAFVVRAVEIPIDGVKIQYPVVSRNRCDWSKRYSLCPEEGGGMIGNITSVQVPGGEPSMEQIAAACAKKDPVFKTRACILENCLRACPR